MLVKDGEEPISDETGQEWIRRCIERCGFFCLSAPQEPYVGEVRMWSGLPLKVVRIISLEEAEAFHQATKDIWGFDGFRPNQVHFEVVVAD